LPRANLGKLITARPAHLPATAAWRGFTHGDAEKKRKMVDFFRRRDSRFTEDVSDHRH